MLRGRASPSRGSRGASRSRGSKSSLRGGKGASSSPSASSIASSPNVFEDERQKNAAIREQKGQIRTPTNGRSGRGTRGQFSKTVRFVDQADDAMKTIAFPAQSTNPSPASFASPSSPFTPASTVSLSSAKPFNPFAKATSTPGTQTTTAQTNYTSTNPFVKPNSQPSSNPFAAPFTAANGQARSNLGAPSNFVSGAFQTDQLQELSESPAPPNVQFTTVGSNGKVVLPVAPSAPKKQPARSIFTSKQPDAHKTSDPTRNRLATDTERLLLRKGIFAPSWPTESPGDPSQKSAMETFWQAMKTYRAKVRGALIQSGQLDDPDKPKRLSEAIDFKGTCEDMCPEFEKITRIVEHDVQGPEKEIAPDGHEVWPSPRKMIKALARSAAGQDAPLPEDVRSPAALRRTLDYLIDNVLGPNELPPIHGFLWDRTRAIRRDFVFQQSSMNMKELVDQVYCLERITRFHVIALHQMSHTDVVAEDFSEQQEVEQLGKALLSLIHAYEDCKIHGIDCENEAEFRAYYVIFNGHNPGILETVQDWGWSFWGEADVVRTAVSLVEALQNIWDLHGPLKPLTATNIAQNGYSRFFSIVQDRCVSYHMACFAEIHFNKVRKAALKTLLASYRKQKLQTEDWTLSKLNAYLHFDDEQDIIAFAKAYGLNFEERDEGIFLSLDSDDSMVDPFPQLKQPHSRKLVERKRHDHSFPEIIHRTVFGDAPKEDKGMYNQIPDSVLSDSPPPAAIQPSFVTSNGSKPRSTKQPERKPFTSFFGTESKSLTPGLPPTNFNESIESDLSSTSKQSSTMTSKPFSILGQDGNKVSNGTSMPSQAYLKSFPSAGKGISLGGTESSPTGRAKFLVDQPITTPKIFNHILDSSEPSMTLDLGQSKVTHPGEPAPIRQIADFEPPNQVSSTPSVQSSLLGPLPAANTLSASPASPTSNIRPARGGPSPRASKSLRPSSALEISEDLALAASQPNAQQSSSLIDQTPILSIDAALQGPPPSKPRASSIAEWVVQGKRGLVDHFIEYEVGQILRAAVAQFRAEEMERLSMEEEARIRSQIEEFRYRCLATKYGHRWRENARRLWMKRKGREARETRRQMAESRRASKIAEKQTITDDFKASQRNMERKSSDYPSLLGGVPGDVHTSDEHVRHITRRTSESGIDPNGCKSLRLLNPSNDSDKSSPCHRREQSENGLRKSIIADHMALPGSSRIHLIPNYKSQVDREKHPSGVQTDYFRLKARGITTLPDGTPLATMAAYHLPRKSSFDGFLKSATPKRSNKEPIFSSVSSKTVPVDTEVEKPEEEPETDIEALKERARKLLAEDEEKREGKKKRQFDDNDEELFARAKRIREQMDEGTDWFKAELQKESFSRSRS